MTKDEILERLKPFKKYRNTKILNTDGGIRVYLYNNEIAVIGYKSVLITDAGYRTVTTKKRLNEILFFLNRNYSLYQRDFVWYLYNWHLKEIIRFEGSYTVPLA